MPPSNHSIRRSKPRPSANAQGVTKTLRKRATTPERLLWGRLRAGRCAGLKFRRQHPLGDYVVDFYCASANLVIEIDGDSHRGRYEQDQARECAIKLLGYRVIRFTHDDVVRNLDEVVEAIARACLAT